MEGATGRKEGWMYGAATGEGREKAERERVFEKSKGNLERVTGRKDEWKDDYLKSGRGIWKG